MINIYRLLIDNENGNQYLKLIDIIKYSINGLNKNERQ